MSEENSNLAEIQKHREQIDEIDREIVALLNKRAGHSLVIRGLKPGAHLGLTRAARRKSSRGWIATTKDRSTTRTSGRFTLPS